MVGEPVDVYAMVGISVDSVNRRSENTRSENPRDKVSDMNTLVDSL